MRLKSWRETSLLEKRPKSRASRQAGSMTLMSVFVYFLISTIGFGLCFLAQTYRKWSSYKADAVLIAAAAENGARAGFNDLSAALGIRRFPLELTDEEYAGLRISTQSRQTDMVEAALGRTFPLKIQETAGELSWSADVDFQADRLTDQESYFAAVFRGTIDSEGRSSRRARGKRTALDVELSATAGRIPLALFPFLLAGENGPEKAAELFAEKKIVLTPPDGRGVRLPPAASNRSLIPRDASPLLARTLKIKIVSPDQISIFDLRRALGLPSVNEPVPDGVYLIADDTGLGGLFIQGDVEEMVVAAEAGWQYLQFRLDEGIWRLWFNPSEFRTEFKGPAETRSFDRLLLPIVMVNGTIASLGGGVVDNTGVLTLSDQTDVPSILAGVSLTIVSAGEIVLTSHLIQEGVRWKDGIPYLKDSTAQLFLYASGANFIDGTENNGRIRIGAGAPADLHIQAALTARDGFQIEGKEKNVTVSGSVQTSSLDPGSGRLTITPDSRLRSSSLTSDSIPRSTTPVLFVTGLEALRWHDR